MAAAPTQFVPFSLDKTCIYAADVPFITGINRYGLNNLFHTKMGRKKRATKAIFDDAVIARFITQYKAACMRIEANIDVRYSKPVREVQHKHIPWLLAVEDFSLAFDGIETKVPVIVRENDQVLVQDDYIPNNVYVEML